MARSTKIQKEEVSDVEVERTSKAADAVAKRKKSKKSPAAKKAAAESKKHAPLKADDSTAESKKKKAFTPSKVDHSSEQAKKALAKLGKMPPFQKKPLSALGYFKKELHRKLKAKKSPIASNLGAFQRLASSEFKELEDKDAARYHKKAAAAKKAFDEAVSKIPLYHPGVIKFHSKDESEDDEDEEENGDENGDADENGEDAE